MADNFVDPSGNTEAFRAFNQAPPQETPAASRTPIIIGGVVLAAVAFVLLWLALG